MPTNKEIIETLLNEFKQHRDAIMDMIIDIEKLKDKIDRLIPESLDRRYARMLEEKIKTVTEFFKTLLDMRKELQKSLKDEIELRRKIDIKDSDLGIEEIIDIRKVTRKIEEFQKNKAKIQDKIVKEAQESTDEISKVVSDINSL